MAPSHIRWFDAARGIAALAVLLGHGYYIFFSQFIGGTIAFALGSAATYAVYVFFFMSGVLITLSIRNNIGRNASFNALDYFVSRVARIYPPLIGAILLVIVIGAVIQFLSLPDLSLPGRPRYEFQYADILTALTMRSGFGISDGPLWSLFIEGQIYIIAGGVAAFGWSKRIVPTVLGAIAIYIGARLAMVTPHFSFYAAIWLVGAACGLISHKRLKFDLPDPPRWTIEAGNFSYSLYVIHFPLLLLFWSASKNAIGSHPVATVAAMILSMALAIVAAKIFSSAFERTDFFKSALRFLSFDFYKKSSMH